jgi:uncharacterized membrane protein YphA (DoxX/SURF4 family)
LRREWDSVSGFQKTLLVVLRFAIGWHFFYQGFGKLISVDWSAEGYLKAGWGLFRSIAEDPTWLNIADYTVIWGLMILGVLLMVGMFTQFAAVAGTLLLLLFYLAIPPLDYSGFVIWTSQGTELYVDKTLIEALALMVVASFRTGRMLGFDILIQHWRQRR